VCACRRRNIGGSARSFAHKSHRAGANEPLHDIDALGDVAGGRVGCPQRARTRAGCFGDQGVAELAGPRPFAFRR
jgi:hypothetical protein